MEITAQNAIYLGEETGGKGRQFKARFLVPGLVKYDYGVCLLTKENADKFIQGFTGCPVVINHQTVTDKNVKDVAVGDIFSVWFDNNDGYYWCNGIIRDKEAIKLINEGYSVSCQYLITEYSDNTKGALHNGNPYDRVIENGKPEHLAIVNNPRYEGAIIAVNAIMAQNADKWITIHPNGEENKGRHLLLKDGESVEDAMHRNGWYKKRQAKEGKKEDTTTIDNKIKSKLETAIKEKQAIAKNPKFYDGFNIVVKDGIVKVEKDGILSSKGFQYNPEAKTGNTGADWNADALGNLITRWNNENKDTKQPDKEEKNKKTVEEIKQDYIDGKISAKEAEKLLPKDTDTTSLAIAKYNKEHGIKDFDFDEQKQSDKEEKGEPKKYTYTLTKKEVGNGAWLGGMADTGNYYTNGSFAIDKRYLDIKGQEPKSVPDIDNNVKKILTETAKKKQKEETYRKIKDFEEGTITRENGTKINVVKYSYYDDKNDYTENVYINKKFNDLFKNFELKFGGPFSPVYAYDGKELIGTVMPISPGKSFEYLAKNSFVSQFKDTLYTVLAEEIFDRLGE